MDNQHSRKDDRFHLSLQGTSIQPGTIPSRPSSARFNSQPKEPITPARGGSAKERRTSTNASLNLSSARQRRLSNGSQRSISITSPPPEVKKSSPRSTSSSVFRVLSPQHQYDVNAFFTDQSQQKSFQGKPDDDEWDDTRRWVDDLHPFDASFTPIPPETQGIGPLGMSRDSLNGTVTGTHLLQTNDNRHGQLIPLPEWTNIEHVTPTEIDLNAEVASITNQRTSPEGHTRFEQKHREEQERSTSFEPQTPTENAQEPVRILLPIDTQQRPSSRRSSASSTSRHRMTPIPSAFPPSSHTDEKIRSVTSNMSSSTSTATSKVTLDDVYETLKKLEEVEQFPIQSPLIDDSVYLIDPAASAPPPFIDELPLRTSNQLDSSLIHSDDANQYDHIVTSVRSQKSTSHRPPSPKTTRFTTPPHSARRQQPIKLVQSASIPHTRASLSTDQQTKYGTKVTIPYRSMVVAYHPTSRRDDEFVNGNTNRSLQQRLNEQREFDNRYGTGPEQEFDHQLHKQKDEYESIIQRHLKFIDQLIDDKRKLSERCEYLVSELKTIDRKCNDRIRIVEESQRDELQKLKDVHEAAEKLRRERWIDDKTKKIKELTVRGLEPEIQKLISKHKNELTKMKTVHEAELLAADERASQRYIRMTEELRDQLEREKEMAIARERELAREKYERSLRDEEQSLAEQRRRLYAEIEEEKNRQADVAAKQRADLDKLRRDIEDNHRTVVDSTKHDYEAVRLEQERRHVNEIQELKEKLTLDRENWEENYMKKQEILLANKERELREQMKQERDKEIEKIISQFESDTTMTKEEAERTAENRVKRIRDKYETEFRELENSEKQTKERYNQIRAQVTEVQGDNERLQVLLKQKEAEINDIKKITETLQQERERLSEIIRQEFADRLVLTDEENRRIKGDIAELRARQQLELDKKKEEMQALQQQQEKELETIHEKIKQAIAKKDEQVHTLRTQYETAVKRSEHLEGLLTQQRKLISTLPSGGNSTSSKRAQQPS